VASDGAIVPVCVSRINHIKELYSQVLFAEINKSTTVSLQKQTLSDV